MRVYHLPPHPTCLIFDIDSTLYTCPEYAHEQIDSQIRHFADLRGMTHEAARALIAEERRAYAAAHGGKKISLGNLFTRLGITIEESIEWRKTLFDPADFLRRDERLIAALAELKKRFRLVCVTNNPVLPAQKTLRALGVESLIEQTVGLDTCMKSKPAREMLERAALAPFNECVSIGDRYDIDLALPLELGMGAILVSGAEDVYELPDIL